MSIRQLWWDWNPKRLRRLLAMKDSQINASVNLANLYHREMVAARTSFNQATQMLDLAYRELRVLRYELEAKEEAQNES